MKHATIPKVCIVKGTHRYETGAHMLGEPLVEELRIRGIVGVLCKVPPYAADMSREAPDEYRTFKKERRAWWKRLAKREGCPVFSLHSYPYKNQKITEELDSCARKIGSVRNGEGIFGVYMLEGPGLAVQMLKHPINTAKHLVRLSRKGTSVWEDATLYHSRVIEVPAIPNRTDATGLIVDIDRTLEAGFVSGNVVEIIANDIAGIVKKSRLP